MLTGFRFVIALGVFSLFGLVPADAQTGSLAHLNSIYLVSSETGGGLMWSYPAFLREIDVHTGQLLNTTALHSGKLDGIELDGVDFVAPDYERRLVVIGRPRVVPHDFLTIPMDAPVPIIRPFMNSQAGADPPIFMILVEQPARALQLAVGSIVGERTKAKPLGDDVKVVGVSLDQPEKFDEIDKSAMRFLRRSGFFGVTNDNVSPMYLDDRGETLHLREGLIDVDLRVPVPPPLPVHRDTGGFSLEVKNDASIVFTKGERAYSRDGLGSIVYYVYSMLGRSWNTLTLPGSSTTVRSFGRWLAFLVSEQQPWAVRKPGSCCISPDPTLERISPGTAGRALNRSSELNPRAQNPGTD